MIGHLQTINSRQAKLLGHSPKQARYYLSVVFNLNCCTVKTKTNQHMQIKTGSHYELM